MKKTTIINLLAMIVLLFGQLPLPAHAQDLGTPSATETATMTPTETTTPGASETLPPPATSETTTETPSLQPTETGTPKSAATGTPEATNTGTATPESAATGTPQASATPALPLLQINLSAAPEFISAGGNVTLNWTAGGPGIEGYDILFHLPFGVSLADNNLGGSYEANSRTYRLPAVTRPPLKLAISATAEVPLEVKAALYPQTAALADILENRIPNAREESLTLLEKVSLPKSGGKATGLNGRVAVTFPEGALGEAAEVFIHRPFRESLPGGSLSGRPFEITARGTGTHAEIRTFPVEVEIEVSYADEGIRPEQEADLSLYYFDVDANDWIALPTFVDRQTKVLRGSSRHFTTFDIDVTNWQASHLPTIEAFQVSGFTGAATYSLPIELPEGPGGFKPELNLSYNSQVVDNSVSITQAGWVGMGWALEAGSIERNSNGTSTYEGDDSFFLSMNGFSSGIVQDAAGYHFSDENFWKVEKLTAPNSWVVSDKTGNVYYFEKVTKMRYRHEAEGICELGALDIRWSLTRIKNVFGRVITYAYTDETKSMNVPEMRTNQYGQFVCGLGTTNENVTTATYLSSIQYPGNTYRIEFGLEGRPDYSSYFTTDAVYHDYQRQRLDSISIKYYDAASASYKVIRQYFLDYFSGTETGQVIFPGINWSGGKTSTLKAIRSGAVENGIYKNLQTTTFSYVDGIAEDNNLHLKRVDNGLGGVVEYTYERWGEPAGTSYAGYASEGHTIAHYFGKAEMPCRNGYSDPYALLAGSSGYVDCAENGGAPDELIVNGTATSGLMAKNLVVPGGVYRVWASASTTNGSTVVLGLKNDSNTQYLGGVSGIMKLPANAGNVELLIKESGTGEAHVYKVKFELLTAGYRVKTKKLSHDVTNSNDSSTYTYTYSGAAVNTHANTEAGLLCADIDLFSPPAERGCYEYVPEYSQFRGHRQVTMTAPDGVQTITTYLQDHIHKGQPETVTVQVAGGPVGPNGQPGMINRSQEVYDYGESIYSGVIKPARFECHVGVCSYNGLYRAWAYSLSQESRVYNSAGAYSATKTVLTYNTTYGNQTQAAEYAWNGSGWAASAYRKTDTTYYPNTSGVYLAGLPARELTTDSSGAWLGESLYLYDGAGLYTSPPSAGKLSGVRRLANSMGGVNYYSQTSYGYDDWGNQTTSSGSTGFYSAEGAVLTAGETQTTSTSYDSYQIYPIKITNALGQATNLTYDHALGVPQTETDPNGATTTADYDAWGRLTTIIRPGDTASLPTVQIFYDDIKPVSTTIKQLIDGSRYFAVRRTYDGWGRQYLQESGSVLGAAGLTFTAASSVETIYDNAKTTRQSAPFGPGETRYYTSTTNDPAAGSVTVTAPDGTVTTSVTDGLTSSVTDAGGRTTSTLKDTWGRVAAVTPPGGPGVSYEYDPLDQLTKTTRAGNVTTLAYNQAGQKTKMIDPDLGTWTYSYDGLGNLETQTDARNCELRLTYDLLNRLIGKTSSGSACGEQVDINYFYDIGTNGKGRRTSMTDASGGASWTYDTRGRIIGENKTIGGKTYTTSWSYNPDDQPSSMTYPDGETLMYGYDAQRLLASLTGSDPYVKSTSYDSAGRTTSRMLGNDVKTTFTYNSWNAQGGRLKSLQTGPTSTPASLQSLEYAYDAAGNVSWIKDWVTDFPQIQNFGYDTLDRLISASASAAAPDAGYSENYSYDPTSGNLANKAGMELIYNSAHAHAVSETRISGVTNGTFQYDLNGNMIHRTAPGTDTTLNYNAEGQLVSVSGPGSYSAAFTYDGDGKRVKSVENGKTTIFIGNYYETDPNAVDTPVTVPNNSFETGSDWTPEQTSPGTWLWRSTWGEAAPHSGSYGYAITNNAYGLLTSDSIPAAPGAKYTLSAWLRGELDDAEGLYGWIVRANFYNSSGTFLSYVDADSGAGASLTTAWAQFSGVVTAPANTASMKVVLINYLSSGWVAFDDISVTLNGGGANLVTNPGFESAGNWTSNETSPGTWIWRSTWGEAAPHSGTYGYAISNNEHGTLTSDPMAATPDIQYTLSTWLRGELDDAEGLYGWIVRANFYDASGTYLSYVDAVSGGETSISPTWKQVSGKVTAPANTASLKVVLINYQTSGWVDFDDVSVTSGSGPNLVANPGFENAENWTAAQTFPATWLWRNSWGEAAPHSGSYGYAISNNAYGSLTSGSVAVSEKTEYKLATWLRGELDDAEGIGGWIVRANFYNAPGELLSTADAVSGRGSSLSTTWQQVTGTVTAPEGASAMKIVLINQQSSGWVAFEDVSATQLKPATKYYYAGDQRVGLRTNGALTYLLGDHLGSTSLALDAGGAKTAELRYKAWGEVRYGWSAGAGLATNYTYTGQRSYMDDPTTPAAEGFGLMYYNARWLDPALGRFSQADTIVPAGVQGLDRYAYVNNNPVRFTDPSGHRCTPEDECVGPAGQGEPDSVNYSNLTKSSTNISYSGRDMANLYLAAWEAKGGYLSVKRFVTLILSHEFQPIKNVSESFVKALQEAAGNWFWCSPNGETGSCTNLRANGGATNEALLNWVAGMESARRRYDNVFNGSANAWQETNGDTKNILLATDVMDFVLNQSGADGHLYSNNPFYWANLTLPLDFRILYVTQGYLYNQYIDIYPEDKTGDPFFILTACQTYYWRGQSSTCYQ